MRTLLPICALTLACLLLTSLAVAAPAPERPDFPKWTRGSRPAEAFDAGTIWGSEPDGRGMVPTNQILTPAGRQVIFSQRANDCAVSPDGRWLAVKGHLRLLLIDLATGAVAKDTPLPKSGNSYSGVLWSADGKTLYNTGMGGDLYIGSLQADGTITWADPIAFKPRPPAQNAVPVGMALSADSSRLYVALDGNNTVAEVDLTTRRVVREIDCDMLPYGVALVGRKLYVT
ncbi:MAG: hypothetical protein WCP21_01585, partial [Armatimonadota bacterium]